MHQLKPKYSLLTAICLVVGIVVGTGVFFKAGAVLGEVNGNLWYAILAWVVGGLIMLISCFNFSTIALIKPEANSMMDFAKVTVGKNFAYYVGIFAKYIYFPAMTATVSFVSSMYFCELLNIKGESFPFSLNVFLLALTFLTVFAAFNIFAPLISGKFQISTTFIKMIPLILMAVVGIIAGLINNTLQDNFLGGTISNTGNGFFAAVCVTAFSYEGWICATNIGGEIKNKEKNLPLALLIGTMIVILIYITYNIGLSGAISNEELINGNSAETVKLAFSNLFGGIVSSLLILVVTISAFGTLNGLTMANSRNAYLFASNDEGLCKKKFLKVTKRNVPYVSSVFGYLLAVIWLLYYFYSQTNDKANGVGFPFSSDELPIITTYLLYIPMLVALIIKEKELSIFKRYVMPSFGIVAAIFMIIASIYRHKLYTLNYLAFFISVMFIGFLVKLIKMKVENRN